MNPIVAISEPVHGFTVPVQSNCNKYYSESHSCTFEHTIEDVSQTLMKTHK